MLFNNVAFLGSSAAPCRVGWGGNIREIAQSTVKLPKRYVNNQRALSLDDVDIVARVKPGALRDTTSNHYTPPVSI